MADSVGNLNYNKLKVWRESENKDNVKRKKYGNKETVVNISIKGSRNN